MESERRNTITITLGSDEKVYSFTDLSIDYDSSDEEIIEALSPALEEEEGVNLLDEFNEGNYTVKRTDNTENVFIFPKSRAGAH